MMTEGRDFVSDSEVKKDVTFGHVDPENRKEISDYYGFEVVNKFSKVAEETTFDKMIDYRQEQMRQGCLRVATAREGKDLIATSVVVLKDMADGRHTLGKEIESNEAFAAGTFILPSKRGSEVAKRLATEQEKITEEAGKKSILTEIDYNNSPSMRFRMNKMGYCLYGTKIQDKDGQELYVYRYKKNLENPEDVGPRDPANQPPWVEKIKVGELKIHDSEVNPDSPPEILISPDNIKQIQAALANNYKGVSLINPELDFPDEKAKPIDKNYIVFIKD